ncbi:probable chitinase 10 [Drosophila biarmipes]|uniref:probable chitinase 10 n=1 Tax=Drosophila biarmipes TaxID=125945 RepID=UPI0021CC5D07|nr:probable chitinase 10 [Drosophila biarmipes]
MSKYLVYLCLGLLWSCQINADHFEECEGAEDETFVQSWESCQSYVYCQGEDSLKGECGEGEYFDAATGECDVAANVQCFLDEVDEPADPEPEPEAEEEEEIVPATPQPTEPPTAPPTEVDILDIAPVVKPSCPISDDPSQVILMASNESCTNYYLCYHGHAMEMHCTNQLYFNSISGQCDYPENVQCALEDPRSHKCLPHMTEFFPHPDNCNYFYYCIKGFLTLQQCPFYYGWDIERRSCVQISVAKCYGNSRRLQAGNSPALRGKTRNNSLYLGGVVYP